MMKRFFALILTLTVLLGVSVPAMAASKDALKVQYEGRGYVEVDFNCRVRYKNTSVTVKDPSGNALAVKITEKDDDDITFHVDGLKPNTKYTFTVSGVKKGQSRSYGTYKGAFRTPKRGLSVKETEYNCRNGKLELEYRGSVQYKNPKATVTDSEGNTYPCRIIELEGDETEIIVKGLKNGRYTVKISGIRLKGDKTYTSVTASFRVK